MACDYFDARRPAARGSRSCRAVRACSRPGSPRSSSNSRGTTCTGMPMCDVAFGDRGADPGERAAAALEVDHAERVGHVRPRSPVGAAAMRVKVTRRPSPLISTNSNSPRQAARAVGARRERVRRSRAARAHQPAVRRCAANAATFVAGREVDLAEPLEHQSVPPQHVDEAVLADAAHVVREPDVARPAPGARRRSPRSCLTIS